VNEVVIHCPACGGRFAAAPRYFEDASVVFLCGACATAFTKAEADAGELEAAAAAAGPSVDVGRRVIVGHALPSAQRVVGDVLRKHGFAPVHVTDGSMVVQACDPVMPDRPCAVVLDVGVTEVLAFEVISHVRNFPGCEQLPIILLASVYERTRYKRRPNRLYGANAYLELHHVPDQLGKMLVALVDEKDVPGGRNQTPADRAHAAPLRSAAGDFDPQALAHRLISDVALYNGDELAQGVSEQDALKYVQGPLDEAKERFVSLMGTDLEVAAFQAALDAFVARLVHRDVAHEEPARQEGSTSA